MKNKYSFIIIWNPDSRICQIIFVHAKWSFQGSGFRSLEQASEGRDGPCPWGHPSTTTTGTAKGKGSGRPRTKTFGTFSKGREGRVEKVDVLWKPGLEAQIIRIGAKP